MRFPLLLLMLAALSLSGCRLPQSSNCCAEGPGASSDSAVCIDCYGVEARPWWTPRLQCTSHLADDFAVRKAAKRCGKRALEQMRDATGIELSRHYEAGFLQAYAEIAEGYPGRTPAVPPAEYWKAYYRTPEGKQAAHYWFEGYAAGADRARAERLREKILVSSSYRYAEMMPLGPPTDETLPAPMPGVPSPLPGGPTPVPLEDEFVPPPLPDLSTPSRDVDLEGPAAVEPPLVAPQPELEQTEQSPGPPLTAPPATEKVVPRLEAPAGQQESRLPESSLMFPVLPPLHESRAADGEASPAPSRAGRTRMILFGPGAPAAGVELVEPDFDNLGPVKLSLEFDGGSANPR